jgi:hypothetical protein
MVLQELGVTVRKNWYNILRAIYKLMPYGYSLIKVKADKGVFKLYTHFEAVLEDL